MSEQPKPADQQPPAGAVKHQKQKKEKKVKDPNAPATAPVKKAEAKKSDDDLDPNVRNHIFFTLCYDSFADLFLIFEKLQQPG